MPEPPQASPSPTCPLSGHQMQSLSLGPLFNLMSLLPFPGKSTFLPQFIAWVPPHSISVELSRVFDRPEDDFIYFIFFNCINFVGLSLENVVIR